jgi:hypothetical protein
MLRGMAARAPHFHISPQQRTTHMPFSFFTLAAIVIAAAIVRWLWLRFTTPWSFAGGAVKLNPSGSYEFLFLTRFPSEASAQKAIQLFAVPRLNAEVSPIPNGSAFRVSWRIVAQANDRSVFRLNEQLRSACVAQGGTFLDVSVSNPKAQPFTIEG